MKCQQKVTESKLTLIMTKRKPNQKMQAWLDARKRHHLSHAQVQMARELGMNPAKLGKLDNHEQEPWKLPLPKFIEELYFKRFDRTGPETVMSIENRIGIEKPKKKSRQAIKKETVPL